MARDPIAPVRRRPRRVAKKLAKRCGMLRVRGWSYERFSRFAMAIGVAAAEALNRAAERIVAAAAPYKSAAKDLRG